MTAPTSPIVTRDLGPAPETEIIRDLVRRGLMVSPVALAIGYIGWQTDGLASVALGLALVLSNFVLAASLQAWAAKISFGLVMGIAMFGFVIRIGLISAVVWGLRQQAWVEPVPLAATLIIGHLGLLIWETRFVSASLAFPGLKPDLIKEHR